jgi:uncharacterized membrane protein
MMLRLMCVKSGSSGLAYQAGIVEVRACGIGDYRVQPWLRRITFCIGAVIQNLADQGSLVMSVGI